MLFIVLSLIIANVIWVVIDYTSHENCKAINTAIHTQLKDHTTNINAINLSVSKLKESMEMRIEDTIALHKLTDILAKELSIQLDEIGALEVNMEQLQTERYKDDK